MIFLGCYAFENARLLLVSGINRNSHVGKHLIVHNYGWFNAVLPDCTRIPLWDHSSADQ